MLQVKPGSAIADGLLSFESARCVGVCTLAPVMIADGDTRFVESNRGLLEAYSYTVHTAPDGSHGLDIAKQFHRDLMILDVIMRALK